MGFSVTIASTIVLIGLMTFVGATLTTMLYTINDLTILVNTLKDEKLNVDLEIEIVKIDASEIQFLVRNTGSKTIFLMDQGYKWNSIIISYNNTYWRPYLIEDYTVLEIKVSGTDVTFNFDDHRYVNPGEEAYIKVNLPPEAPEIPVNSTVTVVFASHYGVTAVKEGARV